MQDLSPAYRLSAFMFSFQKEVLPVWLGATLSVGILLTVTGLEYGEIVTAPLWLLFILVFFQYGFLVIEFTARGHARIPRIQGTLLALDGRIYRQGLLVVLAAALIFATPETWRSLPLLAITTVGPAVTAFIAFHSPLLQAINPVNIGRFIRQMGLVYFPLRILLTSVLVAVLYLVVRSTTVFDFSGGNLVLAAGLTYLLLTMFRGTGILLHSSRDLIGIRTDFSREQTLEQEDLRIADARKATVSDLMQTMRRQDVETAWKALYRELKRNRFADEGAFMEELQKYADRRLLYRLAGDYIGRTVGNDPTHAWYLLTTFWDESQGTLRLESGRAVLELARLASDSNQQRIVIELIDHFDESYPQHPRSREAYLLGTELCCELGEIEHARRLFERVRTRRGGISRQKYRKCATLLDEV